jgi:hypothetical protein
MKKSSSGKNTTKWATSGDPQPTKSRPARDYIKEAMAMNLEQRRALLASLPQSVRGLLEGHLNAQWEWKKYFERQAKNGRTAQGGTPLDGTGSQSA